MSIFPWEDIKMQRVGEGHRHLQTRATVQRNKIHVRHRFVKNRKEHGTQ